MPLTDAKEENTETEKDRRGIFRSDRSHQHSDASRTQHLPPVAHVEPFPIEIGHLKESCFDVGSLASTLLNRNGVET